MRDTVVRFGTFVGIDAGGGGYTGGNDSWLSSLEEMNALAQRDAFIPVRQLTDGVATTSSGLTGIGNLYAQPRLRAMLDDAGFGLINNCEGEVVNPTKGSTGSEAVTGVGTIGTGDDALVWHETNKPNNAKWKYSVMANAHPNKYPLSVFLVGNEPDGNGNRLSAYAPTGVGTTINGLTQVSQLDRTELLRRLALLQRQAYEELRGPNRKWAKQKHPSVVASYANTGTCMQDANPPGGINYSVYHFFKYNNGEFLTTCDVIANHFHNLASTFDTSGVANTTVSPWHLWTAIQQGQALAGTGAIHPIYCNEGGVRESKLPANLPPGTGNYQKNALNSNMDTKLYPDGDDPEHTQHRRLLKVRRTGMMLCTVFYWGYSAWFLYNHNASGDDGMIWCPSPTFTPREPCWTAIKRQFNPHNYLLSGRGPWALTITAKPWADLTDTSTQASVGFHDPVTWLVLGQHRNGEADRTRLQRRGRAGRDHGQQHGCVGNADRNIHHRADRSVRSRRVRIAIRWETVVHGARSRRDLSGPDVAAIFCRDQPT